MLVKEAFEVELPSGCRFVLLDGVNVIDRK